MALLFFLVINIAPLFAQETYSDFERGLKLTEEQQRQIEEIKKRYINEWEHLKREAIRKRIELREIETNPYPNREQIERLQNELREIETARKELYRQYRGEVSKVFNEEQNKRYNEFCDRERRRMRHHLGIRGYGR